MSPVAIIIGILVALFAGFIVYRLLRKRNDGDNVRPIGGGGSTLNNPPPNKY